MSGTIRNGRRPRAVLAAAGLGVLLAASSSAGQTLERSPNLGGVWTARPGAVHFHVLHRFEVTPAPIRKVLNTPTFLLGAGITDGVFAGLRYATNSVQVPGEPNEWEVFGRWVPLRQGSGPVDVGVRGSWNGTAESADGEVTLGRALGPVQFQVAGRAFSAWAGDGGAETAVAAGAVWKLSRFVALAADWARLLDGDMEPAWSAGLQVGIPYTPHTLSLHASNANATTLQSASIGLEDRTLWGFEFTVPVTLSRYFGGRAPAVAGSGPASAPAVAAADTAVVEMDDRMLFLPDTLRIRPGTVVVWRNTSRVVHTVTAVPELAAEPSNVRLPEGAAPFDSGDLVPGDEFVHTFRVPGEYGYVCLPHELAGMVGVVVVEGG